MSFRNCSQCSAHASPKARINVEDIVEITQFSGLDVCPGKRVIAARLDTANISKNRIHHNWVIVEWPTGKVRLRAEAGETINSFGVLESVHPQWSPNCQWVYYRARIDDEVQVWRLNARTGETEKVTFDSADVLSFELAENGREIIYKVGAERFAINAAEAQEYERGVLYDENIYTWHPPLMRTFPVLGRWSAARRWSKFDDNTLLDVRGHLLAQQPPKFKVLQIVRRKFRNATESEIATFANNEVESEGWIRIANTGITVSPSGDWAVVKQEKKRERYDDPSIAQLVSISRKDPSESQKCPAKQCNGREIRFLNWSKDGLSQYFVRESTRFAEGIYAWKPQSNALRTVVQTDGLLGVWALSLKSTSLMPCPIMGEIAFCGAEDHGSPPRLLAIDLRTGDTRIAYDPNAKLREKFRLRTEIIRWTDGFNRKASGILVYPRNYKAGERFPLVISSYKCRGFLKGGSADGGPEYVLAEHGFFALCVNRGSPYPPIEETLKYSPGPRRFVAMVSEYETAIDMLAEKGMIDRRRVGITGISMSARAISFMISHSDYVAAAATRALGLISSEQEMLSSHPKAGLHAVLMMIFNIAKDRHNKESIFDDLDVARRGDRVRAPILVQASEAEYLNSLPAIHALLKLNKPVELHIFPDETHFLSQPIHRYINFTRNLDWFRFWLQGFEYPDPEKEEQYARWRELQKAHCAQQLNISVPVKCR
jgi:dipeptidyl aminopeptidase/acylaminoacyl peptidase